MKKKLIFSLIRNHEISNNFEIFLSRKMYFPLDKNGNELHTPTVNYSIKYAIREVDSKKNLKSFPSYEKAAKFLKKFRRKLISPNYFFNFTF